MPDLLRISARINKIIAILIVCLIALTLFTSNMFGYDDTATRTSLGVSFGIALMSYATTILARRALRDPVTLDRKTLKAGLVVAIILFAFSAFGLAMSISTGAFSYLYIILILAMAFYIYCVWTLRMSKEEREKANEPEF